MPNVSTVRTPTLLVISAGLVGNVVEWFDFAVYGNFAIIIGQLFFPSTDPHASLLASYGAFAAGFLARPLGGILLGRLGDVMGRQAAMTVSILAMSIPTLVMAVLPGFETWGIFAPTALVVLRIIQGLSVGGEYTSSLIFLAEHSSKGHKAINSVWGLFGGVMGMMLGSLLALAMAALIGDDAMKDWGWRVMFACGGLVALTGLWVRRLLPPEAHVKRTEAPISELVRKHLGSACFVFLMNIGAAAAFYTVMVYSITYVTAENNFTRIGALELNIVLMALMLAALPFAAWISDRYGLRRVLLISLAVATFASVFLFQGMDSAYPPLVFLSEAFFVIIASFFLASLVAFNVGLLPPQVRCTGLAIAYNAAVGIFGGATPFVATWLIKSTGNPTAPAFWLAAALAVSFTALLLRDAESET